MSKHTMTINPICIPDGFNLGEIIYEKLNEVSSGWLYSTTFSDDNKNRYDYITRKLEKKPEYGYGFRVEKWIGSTIGSITIAPTLVSFSGDSVSRLASPWVTPIYASKTDPSYTKTIESDLTIFIGKQKKCYSVSVTPHDSGYVLMNAVCGENVKGDPYIFYPGTRPDGAGGDAMRFVSIELDKTSSPTTKIVKTNYYTAAEHLECGMGLIDNNQKLALAPFVNPCDGTLCPDLYMSICGPMTARVYDVAIGSRKFCTGSSNAPETMGTALSNATYQAYYKVFMEV